MQHLTSLCLGIPDIQILVSPATLTASIFFPQQISGVFDEYLRDYGQKEPHDFLGVTLGWLHSDLARVSGVKGGWGAGCLLGACVHSRPSFLSPHRRGCGGGGGGTIFVCPVFPLQSGIHPSGTEMKILLCWFLAPARWG